MIIICTVRCKKSEHTFRTDVKIGKGKYFSYALVRIRIYPCTVVTNDILKLKSCLKKKILVYYITKCAFLSSLFMDCTVLLPRILPKQKPNLMLKHQR